MPKSRQALLNSHKKPGSKLPYIRKSNKSDKEWEEIRCTICMEHPHNAVLVLCSSHEKGCRPYMCDTKSPLFDCYKQFRNSSTSSKCPLCRGEITGHKPVSNRGRMYMNKKPRTCSQENCEFSGTYMELIKHVEKDHAGEVRSSVSDDGTKGIELVSLERGREYEDAINASLSNVSNDGNPLILIHYHEQLVENRTYDVRLFSYVPVMPSNLVIHISRRGIDGASIDQIRVLSSVSNISV